MTEGKAKGGRARAAALSPERRSAIARSAATARWSMKTETRINPETHIVLMAEVDGWVMVRRPSFKPFVMKAEHYRELEPWRAPGADDGDG